MKVSFNIRVGNGSDPRKARLEFSPGEIDGIPIANHEYDIVAEMVLKALAIIHQIREHEKRERERTEAESAERQRSEAGDDLQSINLPPTGTKVGIC